MSNHNIIMSKKMFCGYTLLLVGSHNSCILPQKKTQPYNRKDIRLSFCIYKAWILVHTKPLYSNAKLVAFWRNAYILNDTGLEFCQAAVSFIKRVVHMYILKT